MDYALHFFSLESDMNCTSDDYNTTIGRQEEVFDETFAWVAGIPAAIVIFFTIAGNGMVLSTTAQVGHRATMLLVWNLGLADFMVGCFVLPLSVANLIQRRWVFGRAICRLWISCDLTFCTASIITICVISVDRYMAVTRPLRYKVIVTKFKVVVVIILVWTCSICVLLGTVQWSPSCIDPEVCFVGNEIRFLTHSVVCAFFVPACVTITLYWRIYKLARERERAIESGFMMVFGRNMNFLTHTLSTATPLRVHCGGGQMPEGVVQQQRRVLRTHQRIAKTLGLVSCAFLFCWVPFFTLYMANAYCSCIPTMALDVSTWLGYCNSMINPIIYAFTVKEFKIRLSRMARPFLNHVRRLCPFLLPEAHRTIITNKSNLHRPSTIPDRATTKNHKRNRASTREASRISEHSERSPAVEELPAAPKVVLADENDNRTQIIAATATVRPSSAEGNSLMEAIVRRVSSKTKKSRPTSAATPNGLVDGGGVQSEPAIVVDSPSREKDELDFPDIDADTDSKGDAEEEDNRVVDVHETSSNDSLTEEDLKVSLRLYVDSAVTEL